MSSLAPPPAWVTLLRALVPRLPLGRYRLIHWASRRSPPPFLTGMSEQAGGAVFACDLHDAMAREVCFTGVYEPQETALIREILGPEQTFVDVGASWGYFTLLAAHVVGPRGRVLALEPDPRSFAALDANCRRNDLTQVWRYQVAAADRAGTLTLEGYDPEAGNFGVSRVVPAVSAVSNMFQVPAQSLDGLLDEAEIDRVALLKMDVEGSELEALAGLEGRLRGGRIERLLVELHPARLRELGVDPADLVERVRDAGYEVWAMDHTREAARRAAYHPSLPASEWLRPFDPAELGPWPHLLFALRGLPPVAG